MSSTSWACGALRWLIRAPGPGTDDWGKMEAVWCSKDRKDAITQAKRGEDVKAESCGATPVAKQYELGEYLVSAVRRRSSR